MICPANQAVYSTEIDSCSFSLFTAHARPRNVQTHSDCPPGTPETGAPWVSCAVFLAGTRAVASPVPTQPVLAASTMRLEQAGYLKGTESCYLALQGLHLYPALRRETEFSASIPLLFTPAVPAAASADEIEILRQMSFLNETHLEELSSSISSHRIEADINTLFHLHASSFHHASKSYWIICGLIVASIVLVLFIIYCFTQVYIWNLFKSCFVNRDSTADSGNQEPQPESVSPLQPSVASADCEDRAEPNSQVRFSIYSLQSHA